MHKDMSNMGSMGPGGMGGQMMGGPMPPNAKLIAGGNNCMPPMANEPPMPQIKQNDSQFMQNQSQIFVFDTQLANQAAEAYDMHTHSSIIEFHLAQPTTKKFIEKNRINVQMNRLPLGVPPPGAMHHQRQPLNNMVGGRMMPGGRGGNFPGQPPPFGQFNGPGGPPPQGQPWMNPQPGGWPPHPHNGAPGGYLPNDMKFGNGMPSYHPSMQNNQSWFYDCFYLIQFPKTF